MKILVYAMVGLLFINYALTCMAKESVCDKSLPVSAFAQAKNEKSYFYSEPMEQKKLKSYVVAHDFLQILGKPQGPFVCVVYRNYHGYGGKPSFHWMRTDAISTPATQLSRSDLIANWIKLPCSADSDDSSCEVIITEEKGKMKINLASYLHHNMFETFQVGNIQETDGHFTLTKFEGSDGAPEKMEIEFNKSQEFGTIILTGDEDWNGTYHR